MARSPDSARQWLGSSRCAKPISPDSPPHCCAPIQDPDDPNGDIDTNELERVHRVLTLSRVTSVATQEVKAAATDPEFRWRNRELMGRVRSNLEQQLADDIAETGRGFWVNTAHSESNVWLKRDITANGSLNLVVNHGEQQVLVYVQGQKRAIRAHAALLRNLLEPIARPFEDHGDDGIRVFQRSLASGTTMEAREALLTGEVTDLYLAVYHALKNRL